MVTMVVLIKSFEVFNSFMTEIKSMDWFLYDRDLRPEGVKSNARTIFSTINNHMARSWSALIEVVRL